MSAAESFDDDDLDDIAADISAALDGPSEPPTEEPSAPDPAPEAPAPEAPPIEPMPASFRREWEADWSSFSPEWRQRIIQREQQAEQGIRGYASRLHEAQQAHEQAQQWRNQHQWAENYSWVPEVLPAELEDEFRRVGGIGLKDGLAQLVGVWRALQDPRTSQDTVIQLAQRFGVTPEAMQARYQPLTPEQQAAASEAAQLRNLRMEEEKRIADREKAEKEAQAQAAEQRRAALAPQIQAFFAEHRDAEKYRQKMAARLSSGEANSLQEAYDQAKRADPDAFEALVQERLKAEQEKAAAERAKAREKNQAAKTIAGASTPTAGAASPKNSTGTIESDIEAAWDELAG